jgi:hypothetical protein
VGFGNVNFEKEFAMRALRRSVLRQRVGTAVRRTYGF